MFCAVGLGNPGKRYAGTRHNIGYEVVDRLASGLSLRFSDEGFYQLARGRVSLDERVVEIILAKPNTYMNLSGEAVFRLATDFSISPGDMLVIHDDLDLPFGRIRIKRSGSSGGHKGIMSIISALGTDEFPRVKIGIGRPPEGVEASEYVLSPFTPEEQGRLQDLIERARAVVLAIAVRGLDWAMSAYNGPPASDEREEG